jgi:hypothetical protein
MPIVLALAVALATAAAGPDVQKLLLQPAQIGKGYAVFQRQDGAGVKKTVTLDLCGRSGYTSEKQRATRLQVNYLKTAKDPGLSNEVVTYKPGGAVLAMQEVIQHAENCPSTPIKTGDPMLPPLSFTFTRLRDPKLLKGYLAVRVRVRGTVNGKKVDQTSYAAYQRRGNVLSGVYSFGPDTAQQLQFFLHAAEESAKNLERGGAPPSAPTA